MGVSSALLVLFAAVVVCRGKIYTPCELAKDLKNRFKSDFTEHLGGNVSLAVCIAGYHGFDTSHRIINRDGFEFLGIFGLRYNSSVPNCARHDPTDHLNENLQGDLECLKKTVLSNPNKAYMYDRLCSSDLTRQCNCQSDCSEQDSILVPIFKDIIDSTHEDEDAIVAYLSMRNMDYYRTTQAPTTTPTTTIQTTSSTHPSLKSPGAAEVVVPHSPSETNIFSTALISLVMTALVFVAYLFYTKYVKARIAPPMAPVCVFNPMHEDQRAFSTMEP
ncbi:hypothetical protein GE061_014674 [Apolygus lucorum]|uniref:Lysozyme n=1 Tax=Apolygus lucorum TaxID=248454 RepID=A0A8S9XIW2_APOLU|nr:hypothetical protein GE061_014674 [Apolygus lucorum]